MTFRDTRRFLLPHKDTGLTLSAYTPQPPPPPPLLRTLPPQSPLHDRLVGLVVRHPPQKRMIPGSNPPCARIFSGSSHTSDSKIGIPVATLPGVWHYRVSFGTGQPSVSILWLGEVESLICNFYLSVAARKIEHIRPWDTLACCWDVKQPTNPTACCWDDKQSRNNNCPPPPSPLNFLPCVYHPHWTSTWHIGKMAYTRTNTNHCEAQTVCSSGSKYSWLLKAGRGGGGGGVQWWWWWGWWWSRSGCRPRLPPTPSRWRRRSP